MAHYVVCPYCSERYNRDKVETVQVSRRYYHTECYDKHLAELGTEERDMQTLESYIKQVLEVSAVPARAKQQIKKFQKDGYSISGIYKTLYWFYEIKKNSTSAANGGIGIVPFVYEEAKAYYLKLHLAEANLASVEVVPVQEKRITIKPPQHRGRKIRLFNIE